MERDPIKAFNEMPIPLISPNSHKTLQLDFQNDEPVLLTRDGKEIFHYRNGSWDFFPETLPKSIKCALNVWSQLQENGSIVYDDAPSLNLTFHDKDVESIRRFMPSKGITIDIGCGPTSGPPRYLAHLPVASFVGIDPLIGDFPKSFNFLRGLSEHTPFPDQCVDHIVFCRSLDHTLDYHLSLKEAVRILKLDGDIRLLIDDVKGAGRFDLPRYIFKGTRQFIRSLRESGLRQAVRYAWRVSRLKTPPGAIDPFHTSLPSTVDIQSFLSNYDFQLIDNISLNDEHLLIFKRKRL